MTSTFRQSARRLANDWRFSLTAIVTLGLAIAANTVLFGAAYTVLLRPLPLGNADRLFVLWNSYPGELSKAAVAPPEFADLGERLTVFEGLAAIRESPVNLTGAGEPLRLNAIRVSTHLGRVLGIRPAIGRDFDAKDGDGAARVVLLAHHVWRQVFGSSAGIVGRAIFLDGQPHTVAGVLPAELTFPDAASFHMPKQADVWMPMAWERRRDSPRGDQILRVVGVTRRGTSAASIAQDLERVAAGFRREHPDRYSPQVGWRLVAYPFREELVGSSRPALLLLLGSAGLVLAIACANVANLLLGRGAARRKEFGVKAALGAGRARLVKDFTSEALILGGAAGALALAVSAWALPVLAAAAPETLPHVADTRLDVVSLGFTAIVALAVVVLIGIAPALRVSGGEPQPALRDEIASAEQRVWRWLRSGLIVGEVALAFLVLTLAGLLLQTTMRLGRADSGFSPGGAVAAQLSLPAARYPLADHHAAFYDELLRRLERQPQIRAAALADPVPLTGETWSGSFDIDGRETVPGEPMPHAEYARVSYGYFRAMQIPIVAGRDFTEQDDMRAPHVVIVDETLAARYWPGESAIGKRVKVRGPRRPPSTIVGVVSHVRRDGPRHQGEPQIYVAYFQSRTAGMHVVLRAEAEADAGAVATAFRSVVRGLDATLPVAGLVRLDDLAERVTAVDRFNLLLTAAFALCALLLAAVGLYGVIAYLVTRNTREIAIRIALGCTPSAVRRRVLLQGARWSALGVAAGIAGAAAISRSVSSLVFQVSALDGPTLAAAAALTLLISLGAIYLPAGRILRMDPVQALKT